jgi:hypothetical protein
LYGEVVTGKAFVFRLNVRPSDALLDRNSRIRGLMDGHPVSDSACVIQKAPMSFRGKTFALPEYAYANTRSRIAMSSMR